MALTSVFYDGPVTETDRAKNRGGVPDYGVYGVGDFEVKAHPSIPYAVLVTAGRAHGFGVTDEAAIDQVVQCDTLASGTRWDLIVVRRNWQPALGGPSTLVAIPAGTTAAIPAARKVGPGVEDDQPIALVKWTGGLSAPAQIIDLRIWASNGALYARDELVLTYLTGIGTEINVNGVLWRSVIGANNIVSWNKTGELGKVRLFGASGGLNGGQPPNGGDFLIQAGSSVTVTDNSGYARVYWPKPFPNGVLSVVLTNGDDWAPAVITTMNIAGRENFWGPSGLGNKTEAVYVVEGSDTGGNNWGKRPNTLHRVNFIAIGW